MMLEHRREGAATLNLARDKMERRLGEVKRALVRQLDEISAGRGGRSVHEKIVELELEEDRLRAELASAPEPPVVRLHPGIVERYRGLVPDLRDGWQRKAQIGRRLSRPSVPSSRASSSTRVMMFKAAT